MLLTESRANVKLRKSEKDKYRIVGLSLDPGRPAICPHSTAGCRAICVTSPAVGLASAFAGIQASRRQKTELLLSNRPAFERLLCEEIETQQRLADAAGRKLVCRLNLGSDLDWRHVALLFPDVVFYDYTKCHFRWESIRGGAWSKNYHLCFSWSENPKHQLACARILAEGGNVAIAFAERGNGFTGPGAMRQELPGWYEIGGIKTACLDGDTSDLRFTDSRSDSWNSPHPGRGWIVGLRLKSATNEARNKAIDSKFAVLWR